jgi:hypothetical protein
MRKSRRCNPFFGDGPLDRDFVRLTTPRDWTDSDLLRAIGEFVSWPDCPADEPSASERAAALVLVALHRGTNVQRLAALTGYSLEFVEQVSDRMQRSGLWKSEKTDYDWAFGLSCFARDACVASGLLAPQRRPKKWPPKSLQAKSARQLGIPRQKDDMRGSH